MPINTDLLITSDALEEVLIDKSTGLPLAAGIVTFYEDTSRTTLKNIYEQTGTPGAYTYIMLPNPMTLNADGSTSDGSGNNVKIYYYLFDELTQAPQSYYVTVYNSDGVFQFDRKNFPFLPPSNLLPIVTSPSLDNVIVNNRFWNNAAPNTGAQITVPISGNAALNATIGINGVTWFYTTLAPSQHDNFVMQDIIYIQNTNDGTQSIIFGQFPQATGAQTLMGDVTPEYYLDYTCTVAGTATAKYIQIPISAHLLTLANFASCRMTIQANNITSVNNLSLNVFPYAGTGVTSPPTQVIQTFMGIANSWTKYTTNPFTMPNSIIEANLGQGADDGFYMQVALPTGVCRLQIALPSLYLSTTLPTNNFATYDQIDSIVNSPRTGDIRTSMNFFTPFGWCLFNNGTIGNVGSGATNRAASDTWLLYNLFWNTINNTFAPVTGGRGANSYADFSANKTMMLPFAVGQALIGTPPALSATYDHSVTPTWNQNDYGSTPQAGLFTLTGGAFNNLLYPGAPVILSGALPVGGAFTAGTVYYAIPNPQLSLLSDNTFQLASTYSNAILIRAIGAVGSADSAGLTVNFAFGGNFGEANHKQRLGELAAHSHMPLTQPLVFVTSGTGLGSPNAGSGLGTTPSTTTVGDSQYSNIVQPSMYVNVFVKF